MQNLKQTLTIFLFRSGIHCDLRGGWPSSGQTSRHSVSLSGAYSGTSVLVHHGATHRICTAVLATHRAQSVPRSRGGKKTIQVCLLHKIAKSIMRSNCEKETQNLVVLVHLLYVY